MDCDMRCAPWRFYASFEGGLFYRFSSCWYLKCTRNASECCINQWNCNSINKFSIKNRTLPLGKIISRDWTEATLLIPRTHPEGLTLLIYWKEAWPENTTQHTMQNWRTEAQLLSWKTTVFKSRSTLHSSPLLLNLFSYHIESVFQAGSLVHC
jgi:hypothetical protein